ncbi:two-component system sensor histidine kinase NtrB [Desulfovibrio inopinatus]|uniref:two-component system sensor histidine kinase NtrB n=1 Tax=Desulfovibrio inopinatus TaxID=102109 RepID=UPI000418D67B|nr:ATP-binding protein [Desulfovibrio inopinatus]
MPFPPKEDTFCLWDFGESDFDIGIIGTGSGFYSILDIIFDDEYEEFLPKLKLRAVAEPGPNASRLGHKRLSGVPIYDTYTHMLNAHPSLNLIIELGDSRRRSREIVSTLPEHVTFIDHTATFFLCALKNFAMVSKRCRTDLGQQKILLQAIIDEIPDDILLLDTTGCIVDVNQHTTRRLGISKEMLLGMSCYGNKNIPDDFPFFCKDISDDPFHDTLQTGLRSETLETRVNAEGRLRYYRIYSYPISGGNGHMEYILIMRRDITSRTEYEKKERQWEKIDVVERMSTYLAHEIRNPLFTIAGFAGSLLKSETLNEKDRNKLEIILEESARLDAVLKHILAFTRPTEATFGEADVNALVHKAVDQAMSREGDPEKRIVMHLESGLPKVTGEAKLLVQCLLDMIKNSFESMSDGGVVHVETGMDNGYVVLRVKDTGAGMSKEKLENLFSPFFTTKNKGSGLGMAMIRKIMEDFGGKVDVTSRERQGTVITLFFSPVLAEGLGKV